jgi:hypothetical protein
VAVLGSEPEIYFYAQRHSATGYIYTYALTEEQAYASTMQREFIREVESAVPEFVVYVLIEPSWLRHAHSDDLIFGGPILSRAITTRLSAWRMAARTMTSTGGERKSRLIARGAPKSFWYISATASGDRRASTAPNFCKSWQWVKLKRLAGQLEKFVRPYTRESKAGHELSAEKQVPLP